jgi:hypothetical protein
MGFRLVTESAGFLQLVTAYDYKSFTSSHTLLFTVICIKFLSLHYSLPRNGSSASVLTGWWLQTLYIPVSKFSSSVLTGWWLQTLYIPQFPNLAAFVFTGWWLQTLYIPQFPNLAASVLTGWWLQTL